MTDTPPTEPNPTPPPAPAPEPTPPPAPAPEPTPPPATDNSAAAVLARIESLPDRIVDALREATQQPRTPAPPAAPATAPPETDTNPGKVPGKRTFGQRWFGL